jgi:hypothetical protein
VLSSDYFSVPEEEIKNLVSVLTLVGGKAVYGADEFSSMTPKLPPILPEWSPVAAYGGYAQAAASSVSARSAMPHQHIHSPAHHHDGDGFGCFCWAF